MSTSMLLGLFSWIGDFFKSMFDLIPKIIYLFWVSISCVLDLLQLFFRKLAGLDVFYMTENGVTTKISGDIVTQFISGILGMDLGVGVKYNYSTLSTVFYSMILFGIIICFGCILIAIIKSHYSYDEKSAKGPMQYVYAGVKSVINMIAVPIIVVLGLYVSQTLLQALDSITSIGSSQIEDLYGKDNASEYLMQVQTSRATAANSTNRNEKTYSFYDIFGAYSHILYGTSNDNKTYTTEQYGKVAATSQTFSGSMFTVAAFNANRVRTSGAKREAGYTGSDKLFKNAKTSEELAVMIDTAFANNLHLKEHEQLNYSINGGPWVSSKYFTNFLTKNVRAFSKFNIGLVWYYYDLWEFNFIVGFGSIIVGASLFVNIIMGLITRLFMCVGLFLISPPLFGLAPLDGGKATKSWRENFMKQVLMAYGAVVGMNIFFLMLPYFNKITFFDIEVADYFAQTLIIIVGLITIKAFISVASALIGAEDANASGQKIAGEVGGTIKGAAKMTGAAAKFAYKHTPAGLAVHAGVQSAKQGLGKLGEKVGNTGFGRGLGKVIGTIKDPHAAIDAGLARSWQKASRRAEENKVAKENSKKNQDDAKLGLQGLKGNADKLAEVFERLRDGSMSASEAMKKIRELGGTNMHHDKNGKMIEEYNFNNTQVKAIMDQMNGAKNFENFQATMSGSIRDKDGKEIEKAENFFKSNQYEKQVRQPYRDNQVGYVKQNQESWRKAQAAGSSGIGNFGTEAFKNILKGDTFKWADDARAKKKEDAAKGREQQRHSEEMAALKDIANILKSQQKK